MAIYEKNDNFAEHFTPLSKNHNQTDLMTAKSNIQKTKQLKYKEAIARLEEIVSNIESNAYDIDMLTDYVKEATQLIEFCKERLHKTEEELDKILSDNE